MHNFYNLNPNHHSLLSPRSEGISLDLNRPLSNEVFNELFNAYCLNQNEETQNNLGMHLNKMNYLLGIIPDDKPTEQITLQSGDNLKFLICSNQEREVFLPVFTDNLELTTWYADSINTLTVSAQWLWKFVLNQKNYAGIVINPNNAAWCIYPEHIQSLLNDML